jgi:hypothetical protein
MLRTAFAESELQRHVNCQLPVSNHGEASNHGAASVCSEVMKVLYCQDAFGTFFEVIGSCCEKATRPSPEAAVVQAAAACALISRLKN